MYVRKCIKWILAFNLAIICLTTEAQDWNYKQIKKIPLEGDGKWDYLKMDGEAERLFVSHYDQVQVIDLHTNMQIGAIKNLHGAHGTAFARDKGYGYITNGQSNTVTVFDYKTLNTIKTISISGKKPDAIIYETFSKKVFAFCGNSNNAIVIDVDKNDESGVVDLGGSPEFAVFDGNALIYCNLEDKNEVAVIDAIKMKVIARFELDGKTPTGISIDKATNRIFVICKDSKTLVVLDARDGHHVMTLPIGAGADATIFDKERKVVVVSNADGTATIIQQNDADHYKVIQSLTTQPGCKTMVHRSTSHYIYMSCAEKENNNIKPGTFAVYVYGPAEVK